MGFTNLPLVDQIIEQTGFLERLFHDQLEPSLAYSKIAEREPIPAKIGETLTLSRPSLLSLSVNDQINPANNTGLDNGLTVTNYGFEQIQIAVNQWARTMDVSLEQEQALIARLFVQHTQNLGQNAAARLDQLNSITLHTAYDAGNTFATAGAASGATSVVVDNGIGFDTAFSSVANSSPGLPQPVSGANTLTATVYPAAGGAAKGSITITACAFGANTSTALVNGQAFGKTATLTVSATTFAIAAGDNIVASDGAVVIRPNNKNSRFGLANTDVLTLTMLASAAAKLRARGVAPLSNGLFAAIVDPLILPQLIADTAWQRATQGGLETLRYFKRGIPLPLYGIEVVESQMVPYFNLPAAGTAGGNGVARHAVVVGSGALVKAPFSGSLVAAQESNGMRGPSQIRVMDEDILFVLRGPLDRYADTVSMTWKYTGGFAAMTDFTSNASTMPTSDSSRFKRAIVVEVYNPN